MNVRELIDALSKFNPEALVVEEVPTSDGEFVELEYSGEQLVYCGLKDGRYARLYKKGLGKIPCVILSYDSEPRR